MTFIVVTPIAFIFLLVGLASLNPVVLTLAGTACAWIGGYHLWVRRARAREPVIVGFRHCGDYPPVRDVLESSTPFPWQFAKRPWWRGNWPY